MIDTKHLIDVSGWGEFALSELVDEYYIAKSLDYGHLQEGNTAFINRSQVNNGIQGYVKADAYEKPNCITVGMIGNSKHAFWQTVWFVASQNILVLRNSVWNDYSASFICGIINSLLVDFQDYKDIIKKDDWVKNTKIKLPVTSDGQPDWNYMESYMKAVMEESEKSLENLRKADDTKHLIDVSGWGEFSCRNLFECKNTGNILARDVENGSGTTPFVTASGYNNGVVGYIDASKYDIIKGHCILVGGKTFTITYQKDDFVSNDSHNFTIRVKDYNISDLCYLYLVSAIYTYFGQKYSWNDAVTKDKLMADNILLPIDTNGEPDWQYMEDYMRRIMDKSEQIISDLQIGA